jgi:hypothetical protein
MMRRLGVPHRRQLAQARHSAELGEHQRHQMIPGREILDVLVSLVPLHHRAKLPPRNRFQQTPQNRILVAHAKLPFLSLDNQKVTATAWRRLACSRDQSTHSPDSPARKRE